MQSDHNTGRRFLLLQGPHGPFFHKLGKMLRASGAEVWRVGFNAGDQAFWFKNPGYIPYTGSQEEWPNTITDLLSSLKITDLVLYGDVRSIHAVAIEKARAANITVHVFEEGYLRPYWVTYERGGSNGHSRLMDIDIETMQESLTHTEHDIPAAPARWGEMRQHMFYGALYHWFVMFRNRKYGRFTPHRDLNVRQEFFLYFKRLMLSPLIIAERITATLRIKRGGFPFHLCLLQLEHDSSFQAHSPFATTSDFLDLAISGFAAGAPRHHHLVFKAHPLEDGRVPLRRDIQRLAQQYNVAERVHFVRGGKLARLLNQARTAITINSTAAQQVLWRGIPLRSFGDAVFVKPGLVSDQPIKEFFASPKRPDTRAYRDYRTFLLETSQVSGGFYSTRGRRRLMRQIVDLMLSAEDPYDALLSGNAAPRQQLHLVK